MNRENLMVLVKVINAVETGSQVYGKARYNDYTPPYKNSQKEVTCTLGCGAFYGHQARQLIQMIRDADLANFIRLDSANIEEMLEYDWEGIKWKPNAKQKAALIALIDSEVGHKCQDKLMMDRCKAMVEECQHYYPAADGKAQMMFAEIRHLGGLGPAKRIFNRCKDFSLDSIMASLVTDQKDTSSDNQVGDKIYWSRHLKCREFIDRYYVEEVKEEKESKPMAVIIGSARIDENGHATGGKAGDQKQKSSDDWNGEVSKQNWYKHSKGWVMLRAKDPAAREKIARCMEYACANKNIGYDQSQNRTLYSVAEPLGFDCSKVTTPCETDCAQLVRVCVRYAGIKCGDFYTVTEADVLMKTGAFDKYTDYNHTSISTFCLRGDILVTKVKGHTIVVLTNGSKASEEAEHGGSAPAPAPTPTPSTNTKTQLKKDGQKHLNNFLSDYITSKKCDALIIDGDPGPLTKKALIRAFQHGMNLSHGTGLEVDGIFGRMSKAASRNYPCRRGQKNYVVTVAEIAMMLHGVDPNGLECPGIFGGGLESAAVKVTGSKELKEAEWTKLITF